MNKKLFTGVCCALFAIFFTCAFAELTCAEASGWPQKPITLLVGYSAGGSSDLGARFLAQALEKQLGQPIVVENRPGSVSWVAWNQLLYNTPKDGYTFALVNLSMIFGAYDAMNPRKETIDDFDLLANQAIDYEAVAIRKDENRFSDFAGLVEYAQKNDLLVAAAGTGLVAGEATAAKMMEKFYGCKITVVPVDGMKDAETMFISGNTDFLLGTVGDVTLGHKNGEFKAVALFGEERSTLLPDVPTIKELGMGDYVQFSARGYSYAKGVDAEIVAKMKNALAKAIEDPEHIKRMNDMGVEVKLYVGDEYRRILEEQLENRLNIWGVSK
ncbi:MAG: tripartite tricarboxylate transporter substrate binding protein [Synergistaceae bacterium]|jgi:tripartite-type tricarboxylate transporter receptor subunit TctC|nr:tripartite tricarboxylate transporter substrate binding protein [Synergistaceae bacterium]